MISVDVRDVVKRFGDTAALDGVSVHIEPGELFFLLGPSGCGKTTLLRSLAGFYIPDEGSIYFGEDEVTRLQPHKRNTGMMFQSYALWPHMSVAENVGFGLQQRKVPKPEVERRVKEALEAVQMGEYGERKPNQLSGGQQQRVALARALVIRPRCLLLDEPLSNLDAKLRLEMRTEIRRVCKEYELTTIYVTHDQKEALSIADRMAILDKGKILQIGAPVDVYKRPDTRFVADFIGETNFIEGTVTRAGAGSVLVETPLGELQGITPDGSEPAAGTSVTVSIRPECINLSDMPVDENGFHGTIESSIYYGETAQYGLSNAETVLKVSELNPRAVAVTGDHCEAWADPDDVIILSR